MYVGDTQNSGNKISSQFTVGSSKRGKEGEDLTTETTKDPQRTRRIAEEAEETGVGAIEGVRQR
jgi:hypothetical protein